MIGLAPVMAPALTLACGCSLAFLVFNLVVYGPVTIADAVNNYLDRSEEEKRLKDLKDLKDGKPYQPVLPSRGEKIASLDQRMTRFEEDMAGLNTKISCLEQKFGIKNDTEALSENLNSLNTS